MDVARLIDRALGNDGDLKGEPVWQDPRHDFKMALIAEAAAMVVMGIPILFVADRIGLTPQEVKDLTKLLEEANVAVSPGIGFGEFGEGYVRFSLIENRQRIRQAVRSIRRFLRQGPRP